MENTRLLSGGDDGGETPPKNPSGHQLDVWLLNLHDSIDLAQKTKAENKELLYGKRLIDGGITKELPVVPVEHLTNERFVLKDLSTSVGHKFDLRVVQQYPSQQNEDVPLFELEELADHYMKMEDDMVKIYSQSYSGPNLDMKKAPVGTCAVLRFWPDEIEDSEELSDMELKSIVKRIKLLGVVDGESGAYSVKFIDYETHAVLDTTREIFPMDKYFATLPPRICQIELEGVTFYHGNELVRRFLRYDNDEYLFDETAITAEVQASGQALIWNNRFPNEKFPYGINGFLLKSIWEAMNYEPKLPPQGLERKEGFIVYSNEDAYIWLHFTSPVLTHFNDVLSEVTNDKLEKFQGSVKRPKRRCIYLAPHLSSDGSYYRAEVISSADYLVKVEKPEDKVEVCFIDYGDKANVQVKTLVKAEDIHVLLPLFPKLCVKAHLDNIWAFEPANFLNAFQADQESTYGVFVVKEENGDEPAEVIIKKYMDEDEQDFWILNVEAVKRKVAEAVDPFYSYESVMDNLKKDSNPNPMKVSLPPYLGLGRVETGRLQIGSEVDVNIMYHKKMPQGWCFIRAVHRHSILKQMEQELGELKRKMLKSKTLRINKVYAIERQPGMAVLVVSKIAHHILLRGILIRLCRQKEKVEEKSEEENKNETGLEDNTKNLPTTYWKVYLLDYGIVEKVDGLNIFDSKLKYLQTPAFGILAKHKSFTKTDDVQEWWASLPRSSQIPENSLPEEQIVRYDDSQCDRRIVKILKLSNSFPHGETAVVDWIMHRDGDESVNVGIRARQQIAEEKQKCVETKNIFSETDRCEVTDVERTAEVGASTMEFQALRRDDDKLEIDKMGTDTTLVTCASSHDSDLGHLKEICEICMGAAASPSLALGEEYCASDSDSLEDFIF